MANKLNYDAFKKYYRDTRELRKLQLAYRSALHQASIKQDWKTVLEIMQKEGLNKLVECRIPPPDPTTSFFPYVGRQRMPEFFGFFLQGVYGRPEIWFPGINASNQGELLEADRYFEGPTDGYAHCSEQEQGNKSVSAFASAGQSTTGTPIYSRTICGYETELTFPANTLTIVTVESRLNSAFSWAEVNTYPTSDLSRDISGGGGYARIGVMHNLEFLLIDDVKSASPEIILTDEVSGTNQLHLDFGNYGTTSSFCVKFLPHPEYRTLVVRESVELTAEASNAHAFVSGNFTWNALKVWKRVDAV